MTVAEFLDWDSGDRSGARWQLRDGEPMMMAPASWSILIEVGHLLTSHFRTQGSRCRAVAEPGVIPRVRAAENWLIPDIGVTCTPPSGAKMLTDPIVLIEILSPSNEAETRANVWAYTTIPTVAEIVLLRSTSVQAEVLRRQPDGSWPAEAEIIAGDGALRLDSIGFAEPLRSAYRTSGLS
ncbi:MAG: Uma2 family endonuclease [Acetobacteraceae bacterium]